DPKNQQVTSKQSQQNILKENVFSIYCSDNDSAENEEDLGRKESYGDNIDSLEPSSFRASLVHKNIHKGNNDLDDSESATSFSSLGVSDGTQEDVAKKIYETSFNELGNFLCNSSCLPDNDESGGTPNETFDNGNFLSNVDHYIIDKTCIDNNTQRLKHSTITFQNKWPSKKRGFRREPPATHDVVQEPPMKLSKSIKKRLKSKTKNIPHPDFPTAEGRHKDQSPTVKFEDLLATFQTNDKSSMNG
ncbi:12247_t:CDS:1, partial [Acaulospora morrowiae]